MILPQASTAERFRTRLSWGAGLGAVIALVAGVVAGAWQIPALFGIHDLRPLHGGSTAGPIAVNNTVVGFAILALGIVTVSVGSMVVMFINGALIGQVVVTVVAGGQGWSLVTGLLPHLTLEIAGFAVLTACSVLPGSLIFTMMFREEQPPRQWLPECTWFACLTASGLSLLALAALIEGTFSSVRFT